MLEETDLYEEGSFEQLILRMEQWTEDSQKESTKMRAAAEQWVDVIRNKLHFVVVEAETLEMALAMYQVQIMSHIVWSGYQ